MLRFQWNTLRVGDAVFVHQTDGTDLVSGIVAFITAAEPAGEANEIGVRIDDADETFYLWPAPGDVHSDPPETNETCEHCQVLSS